jgi:enoyl-CoA hydratase/carnithine racemase
VHSEYVLLADITIASEDATFADKPHVGFGIVPGDGLRVIYEELLGINRARYFALTQQRIDAHEAKELGLVNEVMPKPAVHDRALEIAERLADKPQLLLRYTTLALRQRLLQRLNEGTQLGRRRFPLNAVAATPTGTSTRSCSSRADRRRRDAAERGRAIPAEGDAIRRRAPERQSLHLRWRARRLGARRR